MHGGRRCAQCGSIGLGSLLRCWGAAAIASSMTNFHSRVVVRDPIAAPYVRCYSKRRPMTARAPAARWP